MAGILTEKGQLHVTLEGDEVGGRWVENDVAEGLGEVVTSSTGYIDGIAGVPEAFLKAPGDV